ncbi:MAG: hypothetical protein ABFD50_23820 [Smithella sp.]
MPRIYVKKIIFLFFIVVFIHSLNACSHSPKKEDNRCITYRAAFDVGSETTKMKVAKVNKCLQKNERFIYRNEAKISYAENYRSGAFTPEIQKAGIDALSRMKNEAINHGAEAFSGVATESFRQASNTLEFLDEVKKKTGISLKLIDQNEEAILGYLAATAAFNLKPEATIVWDIGGSSMQIIFRNLNKRFVIYQGKMASVSFKERITTEVKQENLNHQSSPNPIGKKNLKKAIELAAIAAADVPQEIQQVINSTPVIIGIGGVHNQSVKKQLAFNAPYTQEELMNTIERRIELTDKEIGGRYAATDVSNLILVLGFMKKLGIKEVIPIDVNLADGVLIDPAFW